MRYLIKYSLISIIVILLNGCIDYSPLEYSVDKPDSVVKQEELNTYDVLKSYVDLSTNPNFLTGGVAQYSDYMSNNVFSELVNTNFNAISIENGLQHKNIVQADGSLNFDAVNSFIERVETKGLNVMGRHLITHKEQNSVYLNGLMDPLTINIPPVSNLIDKSGIQDATFTGYEVQGNVSIETETGIGGADAIVLEASANPSNPSDLQLVSPDISITEGHEYEVILFVKSNAKATAGISFTGLNENNPLIDYKGTGIPSDTFEVTPVWQQIKFTVSDFSSTTFKIHFNFGYDANVTYYIDTTTLYVRDLADDGSGGGSNNTLSKGDKLWFEAECGGFTDNSKWMTYEGDTASEGKFIMVPGAGASNTNPDLNLFPDEVVSFDFEVESGGIYELFLRATFESSQWSDDSFFIQIDNGGWVTFNGGLNDASFKWYNITNANLTPGTVHKIYLAFREDGAQIDKLYLTNAGDVPEGTVDKGGTATNCGGVVIIADKTEQEKEFIAADEMEKWVSGMLTNCKESIKSWIVLDEPMDEDNPNEIKFGGNPQTDEFYWQNYLGKDYGVEAFKLARTYGNGEDLLFISDTGLENNLLKCQGLIDYVNYIETNGGEVHGIGAKINVTIGIDKTQIDEMLQLLAQTGKFIAITDLTVSIPTDEPSSEEVLAQSELYQYILVSYGLNIPVSQRYGIFISGIKDSNENHDGLWDMNFNRKEPYAYFANGLEQL